MTVNIFLNSEWQKRHFEKIQKKAGLRYTPDLNVTLDIVRYFDAISKNDLFTKDVKNKILQIKKQGILSEVGIEEIDQMINLLNKKLKLLFSIFSKSKFQENVLWEIIQDYCAEISKIIGKITQLTYKEDKTKKENLDRLSYETRKLDEAVRVFNDYFQVKSHKLSNTPLLLLTGAAGTGKTHLLCDVLKLRSNKRMPTLFLMGEDFQDNSNFWEIVVRRIGSDSIKNKNQILSLLDEAGRKSKQRSLVIIDALNESTLGYWKSNIRSLINDISKYPNIGLVISIRNGYERILLRETLNKFTEIEHRGFEGDIIWNATKIYFKHYNIKFSDFPVLNPEFKNPLFLKFFCERFENCKIDGRGGNSLKDIFEDFVIKKGKEIIKNIPSRSGNTLATLELWNNIIKGTAIKMANNGRSHIYKNELLEIIRKYYSVKHSKEILNRIRIKFMLEFKIKNKTYYKFSYNRFSDHLIVRYVLGSYKRPKNRINAFKENGKIGKILKKYNYDSGILEAFFIQSLEFCGKDLFVLAPYLKNERVFLDALVESIIWIKPDLISDKLKEIIEKNTIKKNTFFLEQLITLSSIPNHKLNSLFLNKILQDFKMSERDSWWTIYLNDNFNSGSAIDRVIQWCWDNSKRYKEKDAIFLTSIILGWFLTSSNRFLRDKTTKALTLMLKDNQDVLLRVLKHFEKTDDPYIKERLYAVMYGSVLTNHSDKQYLKEISQYIYDIEFKERSPTPHILIRDYALQTVLFCIQVGAKININDSNLKYPFKSFFPKGVITEKKLKEKYYPQSENLSNQEKGISRLWGSVMGMGDFSRYVLGTNHKGMFQWSGNRIGSVQRDIDFDLSIAERWILNRVMKLGWDVKLHGDYDFRINRYNYGRSDHKIERIGKKYQWIAYHEFISRVADNFVFKGDMFTDDGIDYRGAWRPHYRDIDPSFLLTTEPSYPKIKKPKYNFKGKSNKWIKKKGDIFPLRKLIELKDSKNENWFVLEGNASWIKKTNDTSKRDMGFYVRSYIVKEKYYKKIIDWLGGQGFLGGSIPESKRFYEIFLGEYFKSDCYSDLNKGSDWINHAFPSPAPNNVMSTAERYFNEFTLDCSHKDSVSIILPAKLIVNKLNLSHRNFEGMFYNKSDRLACFSNSIFESNPYNGLFISKLELRNFLKENNYCLIWVIFGDKMEMTKSLGEGKRKGRLYVQGIYGYNGSKLIGNTRKKFEI